MDFVETRMSIAFLQIKVGTILLLLILIGILLSLTNMNPSSSLYSLKRGQEKVFLSLKPTAEAKADYLSTLLDERLEELSKLVENGRSSYLTSASLRYSTTVGELTNLINDNNLPQKDQIIKKLNRHKNEMKRLIEIYPADDTEHKYLIDDLNYLNIYLEKLATS